MSTRCGQNPVLMMAIEGTYGTANLTPTVKSGSKFNFQEIKDEVAIDKKTGQITTQKMESNYGNTYVDGTIEGTLTRTEFDIFLQALTNDSATPWIHSNSCTRPGLTIIQYFDDGTIGTATDDHYNIVTGALLTQLTLTMNPNSNITFSATIKGKAVNREVANTGANELTFTSITDASHPNYPVAKWGDITVSLGGSAAITAFNTGTLTLTNELCSDDILFQNNDTIINPLIMRAGGTLNASWIYDTTDDPTIYDNIQGTIQSDTITILFGTTDQYTITTLGKIESYENPDPDRCKFISSFSKKLMGDYETSDGNDMIEIKYTDLS